MIDTDAIAARKRAIRSDMRAARAAFAHSVDARAIVPPPAYLERLAARPIVATYLPIGGEADPALLVDSARAAGCTLALPFVTSRAEPIRFVIWDEGVPLESGPFGLRQPPADACTIDPAIVLVPLVAFDARCHRLGQGAGHYDRALAARSRAWRLGVAWSMQQVESVPVDAFDVPLDAIVTERDYLEGRS
ncbi:5-formyltetrahydrofolate cyclo-ligase [Sphingomonas baiyangensis]|uniref:5-formyltetrahydrofolate cyclo-ligase n=1 Tax=Sphingomonas baiyangensis TaxID=2572576 RepID=A0A4U1L5I8_9SPHN|nr:5-formyltetrahydrofolate cyclo-ligase [Sphingomonas baiyangensis]TKD52221.1 5-formyltetrahydrofolate cyclo-ligase [Sphingomonas baiyangensis]